MKTESNSEASTGRDGDFGYRPARPGPAGRRRDAIYLIVMRDAAIDVAPRGLLRVPEEPCPRDVLTDPDRGASEAEELLNHVSAIAIAAVCLLIIDSRDLETLMVVDPRRRFAGVDDRTLGKRARMKEAAWLSVSTSPGPICHCAPGSPQQPGACRFGSGQNGTHDGILWLAGRRSPPKPPARPRAWID